MAMKRGLSIALATGLVTLGNAFPEGEPNASILSEVAAVKGKLVREEPAPEVKLRPGDQAGSGSLLRTGWRSSAEIVAPDEGAHFTLGSRTRGRVSENRSGALLEVENGRLLAVFDKLTFGPMRERNVVTPSAIFAVRETEYGVAVSKFGETNIVVFSGVVDVTDLAAHGPAVSVKAGEYCTIKRGQLQSRAIPHDMNRDSWDMGHMPGSMSGNGSGSSMGSHSTGHSSGG